MCECVWSRSGLVDVSESGWSLLSSLSQITPLKRGQSPTVTGSIAAASGLSHSGDRPRCRPVPSLPPYHLNHTYKRERERERDAVVFHFLCFQGPVSPTSFFSLPDLCLWTASCGCVSTDYCCCYLCVYFFLLPLVIADTETDKMWASWGVKIRSTGMLDRWYRLLFLSFFFFFC